MERYKTIHENKVMINPPDHKPGSSYTEHELGLPPAPEKVWKRVPLPDRKTIKTPTAPMKPRTPLDWNWMGIITWSGMGYIAYRLFRGIYNLIFNSI
jgi:hypothetical protein